MKNIVKKSLMMALALIMTMAIGGCGKSNLVTSAYLDLDLDKYISLPDDYLSYEWEEPTIEVTDEMVDAQIKLTIADSSQNIENNEGEIKDGDKIHITYVAKNGKGDTVAENKDGYDVEMGKDYITGDMETALLGHRVGDTVEISGKVSDDFEYDESLQGSTITYYITITKKYDVKQAELNDEWVKKNSEASTVSEYRELVRQYIYDAEYESEIEDIYSEKWNKVIEDAKVLQDVPEEIFNDEVDYFQGYVYYNGYQNMGLDIEALSKEYAEDATKQKLVLYQIAELNDLIPTKDEFAAYCTSEIEAKGYDEDSFVDTFVYSSYDYGLKFGWLEDYLNIQVKNLIMGLKK